MKTISLKETLKNNLRKYQLDDARQYHLTHDYYSGRKLNSNCAFDQASNDAEHEVLVDQVDFEYINTLLFPQPTFGNAFTDALEGLIETKKENKTQMVITKPSDDLVSRLTHYYLEYLENGVSELMPNQSERLAENSINLIRGVYADNAIIVKNICILSEFWIRSPLDWAPAKGVSLFEYLFVEYSAPACLKKCWYQTATQENMQWLIAYIAYGQGGSVKKLAEVFEWVVPTNKLWHQLLNAPTSLSPREAVRYCELKRLNASDNIIEFMDNNKAYAAHILSTEFRSSVNFWYSMVRWLVANEECIIGTEMGRVLVWARHQFTEFEKAGNIFLMNGRSVKKVQADTLAYHQQIIARRREAARRAELRRLARIERERQREEAFADFNVCENRFASYQWKALGLSFKKQKWQFVELLCSEDLYKEGEAMEHCVASYDEACNEGNSAIISLRHNGERKATIEIDPELMVLVQASGQENRDLTRREREVIECWLKEVVEKGSFKGRCKA